MNQVINAAVRKRLITDLKILEKAFKKEKAKKVVDFEIYKGIKERIEFIKSKLII